VCTTLYTRPSTSLAIRLKAGALFEQLTPTSVLEVDRLLEPLLTLPIRTPPATTFCTISFGIGKGLLGESYAKLPV
jgi:hypothetical protein